MGLRYQCRSQHCNSSFDTERGLNTHRASCERYKRHEIAALDRRKARSAAISAKKKEFLDKARTRLKAKVSLLCLYYMMQARIESIEQGAIPIRIFES